MYSFGVEALMGSSNERTEVKVRESANQAALRAETERD